MDWLVTTEWLQKHADESNIVILDCTWFVPDSEKNGFDEFLKSHIPTAQFIDLNVISDPKSPYANMLPSQNLFASECAKLGIKNDTHVIVYDSSYVSARLWWMFRVFGHQNISILDGGLRKWKAENRPLEVGPAPARPMSPGFTVTLNPSSILNIEEMKKAVKSGDTTVVDARTPARFDGIEGSGYPGVPSGFMPGAINIHWGKFFDAENNFTFISKSKAAAIFETAGIDLSGKIVCTCGSGVTAALLGFMIERLGNKEWKLYDGSWHEWAQQIDTEKLTVKD